MAGQIDARALRGNEFVRCAQPRRERQRLGHHPVGATYPKGYKTQVPIMPAVRPSVVSFPAAFGHWPYNSGHWTVDGETHRGDDAKNARTRMNHLMRLDPSITAEGGWGTCLQDPYGGSACYYDTRVQIEKTMVPKEGMYIREARI